MSGLLSTPLASAVSDFMSGDLSRLDLTSLISIPTVTRNIFERLLAVNATVDTETEYTLQFNVAGVPRRVLNITITRDMLNIRGNHGQRVISFQQTLPRDVDVNSARAVYDNGSLCVSFSRIPPMEPRTIEIENAE